MIVSPGAKINLGLYITGKRTDGYHNLLTLFYPIPFSDSLEIIITPTSNGEPSSDTILQQWAHKKAPSAFFEAPVTPTSGLPISYSSSGIPIGGDLENNLCIKAYGLLKEDFPALPAAAMHLHKNVPMGAGLGGGSADGAATLKALNQLGKLGLSEAQLLGYAERLGSDCPFFIKEAPQIATGKGEILYPAPAALADILKGYTLILICPLIHVPTATAFKSISPKAGPTPESLLNILYLGPEHWKGSLINEFEASVFSQFAAIAKIKADLYLLGAAYASMTGTGSSVYGLFAKEHIPTKEALSCFGSYIIKQWSL